MPIAPGLMQGLGGGTGEMMEYQDLHPIAQEVLNAYSATDFFRSVRFTRTLAGRASHLPVAWALELVEQRVSAVPARTVVTETLAAVRCAIDSQSDELRSVLDDLSWRCWSSGSFDDSSPYLQRAVARLGWAAICLICHETRSGFKSLFTGLHLEENDDNVIREMTNQCASAIDITYSDSESGRLMVAASFSRKMKSEG